ncbi:unnamed protein product [Microthlaspi erraticum]|uniref:Uncharacterized protein n=1 Tax=Microthlaspi erraticum TaxID=1685480 RepID=A0A6D2JY93_9BRAS|nr:unnamed protein product [Microthlaspi erraticum]
MKLKEFNAKVKSLPFYVTFEEAWDKHDLVEFFFTTSETKKNTQLFQKARFPIAPHAVNQPSSPPSHHHLNASMSSNKLGATTHSPPSSTTAERHLRTSKSFLRKLKFSLPSRPSTRLKTQVNSLFPVKDWRYQDPGGFHVMNIKGGCDTPLILGRPFLATAGAVMDLPNRRMSLANVDKTVFYKTIPFISPNKLSYLITAQGRPREPPDHTQGHNETRTKRLCLRPCPYPISN